MTKTTPDYGVVLKQMNGAIRRLEMYPAGHPATVQAVEKPFSALQEVFESDDRFVISRVEDKIVVNGKSMEGTDLLKRFTDEFEDQNITSLTVTKNLTKEELGTFLSFFVKPLGKSTQTVSLPEFIRKNQIRSITVDQLRYELVTQGEVVVKSEVVEGADLKVQISSIFKDNPELLRDVFLGKSVGKGEAGELKQEMEDKVKGLSDDDLLSLLASSLERGFTEHKPEPSEEQDSSAVLNEMTEMAKLVDQLLQGRDKDKLLPQIKGMLSERGIVEKEHLELLFDERWLKGQEVLDQLMGMIDKLGKEEVDLERFMFLWQRVTSSDDTGIKSYALDKLLLKLDSEDNDTWGLVISIVESALDHSIQQEADFEFTYIKERLYHRIKDHLLPAEVFKDCSRLLKTITQELINRQRLSEAHQILREYQARTSPDSTLPQETKKVAEEFIREVSNDSTLAALTSQMREGASPQDLKLAQDILELLEGERVAGKLLEIFTINDRAARVSALRLLSRLGRSSISAFSKLLSSPPLLMSKRGSKALANEEWYQVRNIVYVLGNIPDAESIKVLSGLSKDPDLRVRLEVVKALEKLARPDSVKVLLGLLEDQDEELRRRVISSLTTLGDPSCLGSLLDHLRHNPGDGGAVITAIAEIGQHKSVRFLLDLLWEREKALLRLPPKQKDEITVTLLKVLGKIGSAELTSEIERFVKHKRRGLKSLLVRDKVTEAANRALKTIESKNRDHPDNAPEKIKVGGQT
jgi:HEAT repeat protein